MRIVCGVLLILIFPRLANAQTFYSQSSGAFDTPTNWNTATDGSGSAANPGDLTSGTADFVIQSPDAMTSPASDININNLTIEASASFDPFDNNITINGQTQIAGTFMDTSPTGTNVFVGLFHVNNGGNMSSSFGTHEYRGGIGNAGTFDTGIATFHDFTTNSQVVSATTMIDMNGQVDFNADVVFNETSVEVQLADAASMQIHTGFTVTNRIVTGFLSQRGGSFQIDGTLINDTGAHLKIWSASPEGTLVATASGNTVEYFRSGSQTILEVDYYNLMVGSSGVANTPKDFDGLAYNISGDLEISNSDVTATNANINLSGNLSGTGTSSFTQPFERLTMQGASPQIINVSGFAPFEVGQLVINNETTIRSDLEASNSGVISNSPTTIESAVVYASTGDIDINAIITVDGGRLEKDADGLFSTAASFDNAHMIICENGGLVRNNSPSSGDPTLFPLGTTGVYTPIIVQSTFSSGATPYLETSVTAAVEPNVINSNLSLTKYWTINSNDLTVSSATVTMTYDDTEIQGFENQYLSAFYGSSWRQGNVSDVIEASNSATFAHGASSELNGNYTVGELGAFNAVPTLVSTSPIENSIAAAVNSNIVLTFSDNMSQNSVDGGTGSVLDDNIQIRSDINGLIDGTWSGNGTTILTFNPTNDFDAGEVIYVSLTRGVQSSLGVRLTNAESFQFSSLTTTGPATPDFFEEQVVSTAADGAFNVHVGDVDGDGDLDILSASSNDNKIAWYENDGAVDPTFTERTVSTSASNAYNVNTGDVDGDGDLDILSASNLDDKIAWYENDGAVDPSFTERVVSSSANGAWNVHTGDLDGDGDLDILSASELDNKIAWYENDGASDPMFSEQVVSTGANRARGVNVGDIDGDGDLDILSASPNDAKIAWYENDGALDPLFVEQMVSTNANGATSVAVGDADGDGDLDIFSASGVDNKIAWYENDGALDPAFTEQIVSTSASGATSVKVADVDGDGDLDILSASFSDNKIAWYENNGAADPTFTERIVSNTINIASSVSVGDVDADGDLDILSSSNTGDKISWFGNTFTQPGTQASAITFSNIGASQMEVSWTNGNGTHRIVKVKGGGLAEIFTPTNGVTYTANAAFGSGQSVGTDSYIVYNDTGNSFTLTNLTPGTNYSFQVFEYNGGSGEEKYNTSTIGNSAAISFAPFTVINTNDSGDGSLRQSIDNANNAVGANTITFNISNTDPGYSINAGNETWTMSLTTDLPDITEEVVLDATTQPGTGNFRIVLADAASVTNGLSFTAGGSEIYGFYLSGFSIGIEIIHLGSTPTTIGAAGKGNTIVNCGIGIRSQLADGHTIHGNYIGTDENSSSGLGNTTGISFPSNSSSHFIGGSGAGEGNVISGNSGTGISMNLAGNTQIVGNYIGTDVSGMTALPNNRGISVGNSNSTQIIDNVLSSNTNYAIQLNVSNNCVIQGNYIGVASDGTTALGNGQGVEFLNVGNIDNNIIGGTGAGEANIIANNTGAGVFMNNLSADNNSILGNSIFCNGSGIDLGGSGNNNIQAPVINEITSSTVGGTGTSGDAIHVYRDNSGCTPGTPQGQEYLGMTTVDVGGSWQMTNLVINLGTDLITATATNGTDGTSEFADQDDYIVTNTLDVGTGSLRWTVDNANNAVGASTITFSNSIDGGTISLNSTVTINSGNGNQTAIDGDIDGDNLPNITIETSASNYNALTIEAANCTIKDLHFQGITGTTTAAIYIDGDGGGATGNRILGNHIGTNLAGTAAGTTNYAGVRIEQGADGNIIGDGTANGANVIGNNSFGIIIDNSDDNDIIGNFIGIGADGATSIGNVGRGIQVRSSRNTDIGAAGLQPNIISSNSQEGILLDDSPDAIIVNNYIGTDATGLLDRGNGIGISLEDNSDGAAIGGTNTNLRNIISGNGGRGIHIQGTGGTMILGNYIGIGLDGDTAIGNDLSGVDVADGDGNQIGSESGGRNVISSNSQNGIQDNGDNTLIYANYIGTNASGTLDRGNGTSGIQTGSGSGLMIGSATAGRGNIISGNVTGISVNDDVTILGNYIGTNAAGTAAIPNNDGIRITGSGNMVGNDQIFGFNVISGNNDDGVYLRRASGSIDNNTIAFNIIGLAANGTDPLGNGQNGVFLGRSANNNTISQNTIASNTNNGIELGESGATDIIQNTISRNSIFNNGMEGISITNGAQNGIVPPSITGVTSGTLSGLGIDGETIEAFVDNTSSNPQGQTFIRSTLVSSGVWSMTGTFTLTDTFTATASDPLGNTSEFATALYSPTNLLVQEISASQIDLVWTDNSDNEDNFTIERATDYGFTQNLQSFSVSSNGSATATFSNTTLLAAETAYFYRVKATNSAGESGYSNIKAGTTITSPGNALDFDGVDDAIAVGDIDAFDGATTFTVEAWVMRTGDGGFSQFFGKNDGSNHIEIGIPAASGVPDGLCAGSGCTGSDLYLRIFQGVNNYAFTTSGPLVVDTWVHVAVVYDGSGATDADKVKIYINGFPESVSFTGSISSSTPVINGSVRISNSSTTWLGELDEMRFWSDVRTQAEILANLSNTLVGNEENLEAYYRFDQGIANGNNTTPSVNILPDRSQNQYDGTLTGFDLNNNASNWVNSEALNPPINRTLDFDAVDDWVEIPHHALYSSNPLTVELWFFKNNNFIEDTPGFGDGEGLIHKNETFSGVNNEFSIGIVNQNPPFDLQFCVGTGVSGECIFYPVEPMTWYHVAGVINGSIIELFVDGKSVGQADLGATAVTGTAPVGLANAPLALTPERFLNGKIDELRIWNQALTATDIQANIFNELTGNESNLVAYFDFNQGIPGDNNSTQTSLIDRSSTGNDGTLRNFGLTSSSSNWVLSTSPDETPNNPANLLTTEISTTQIDLTWDDCAFNETGYTIERSDGNNSNFAFLDAIVANQSTYSDMSVTAGNGYYYRVTANGVEGDSEPSNERFGSTIVPPGNALDFDGVDDYVEIPQDSNLDGFSAITLEAWVYRKSIDSDIIAGIYNTNVTHDLFYLGFPSADPDKVTFSIIWEPGTTTEWLTVYSSVNIPVGEWTHIAGTWAGGTDMKIYVNGSDVTDPIQTNTPPAILGDTDIPLTLGASRNISGTLVNFLDGRLDEVRLWNVARSATDIQNNLSNTLTGNEGGLQAYYRFDQGVANNDNTTPAVNTLPDRSPNQNDGTLYNFTLDGTSSNWVDGIEPNQPTNLLADGKYGLNAPAITLTWDDNSVIETDYEIQRATDETFTTDLQTFNFGGVNAGTTTTYVDNTVVSGTLYFYRVRAVTGDFPSSYSNIISGVPVVEAGNAASFGSSTEFIGVEPTIQSRTDYTFICWFKGNGRIYSEGAPAALFTIDTYPTWSFVAFSVYNSANTPVWQGATSLGAKLDDDWNFIALSVTGADDDGGDAIVVLNNSVKNDLMEVLRFGSPVIRAVFGRNVGSAYGSQPDADFEGEIDEAAIFSRALTEAEIFAIRDSGINPGDPDLLNLWHFDEPESSTTIYDASGNENHGTRSNGPVQVASEALHPFAPENYQVVAENGQAELQWDQSSISDFKQYNISYKLNSDPSYTTITETDVTANSITITGLNNSSLYDFKLSATDLVDQLGVETEIKAVPEVFAGNAAFFDGTNSAITTPDNNIFNRGTGLTLEAWIRADNLDNTDQFLVGVSNAFRLGINSSNELEIVTNDGGTSQSTSDPTGIPFEGQWAHVAMTFQGTTSKLYLNGNLVDENAAMPVPQNSTQVFRLGVNNSGTTFFDGLMDEVRLWDQEIDQATLQANMFTPLRGDETNVGTFNANLLTLWHFDEPTGYPTAHSSPSNLFDGTLAGNADFVLSTAMTSPEIDVYIGMDNTGTEIIDGQVAEVDLGASHVTIDLDQVFALDNPSANTLTISSINVSGTGYSIVSPPTTIAPGATETFVLRLSSASTGSFVETVTIISNDIGEGTFTFPVRGFLDTWNIDSTFPLNLETEVPIDADIEITFDDDGGDLESTDYLIYGEHSGIISASGGYNDEVLTLDPTNNFFPGELITVVLTSGLEDLDGIPFIGPYIFEFRAATITGPETPDYFSEQVVSTSADGARSVNVGDIDGDGDLDILSASFAGNKISWYENDGAADPVFAEQVVSNTIDGPFGVHIGDMDGDGDLDILSASNFDDKIAWYENDGAIDPTFIERVVSTSADGARSVNVGDMDGDGDLDILSASNVDDKIAWYENDGAADPTFTERVVSSVANGAQSVSVGDVDGDGDLDILSASFNDSKIAWYENDGAVDPTFAEQVISAAASGAQGINVGDMDGDGDLDVLWTSQSANSVAWFENDGASDPGFSEQVVSTSADGAAGVHVNDMDGDGDLDILSASFFDDKIAWYENDGTADPAFVEREVSTTAIFAFSVNAGDMDGDGDLDILSASGTDNKIAWYENTTAEKMPHVYWTENVGSGLGGDDEIHRTDLDGNDFEQYYTGFGAEIAGLEIDTLNNRLYWTDASRAEIVTGEIGVTELSVGPDIILDYNPGSANDLEDLALDVANGHIYFTHGNAESGFTHKIARVDIDGTNDIELIDTGEEPFGIDLDLANGKIYYTTNVVGTGVDGRLYRANLDGTNVEELFILNTAPPFNFLRDVKIDPINERVYWSAGPEDDAPGTIYYNDINESAPFAAPRSFSFAGEPRGIDLDLLNNKIYWVCRGANDGATPPMIMRANLNGTNIETIHTVTIFPADFPPGPPGSAFIALDLRGATANLAPEIAVYNGMDNSGSAISNGQITDIDFGTNLIGTDLSRAFAIENIGTEILNISNISVSGGDFSVSHAITSIAVGETMSFTVTLSGSSVGTFNSTVTVDSDDADESSFTFPISGEISDQIGGVLYTDYNALVALYNATDGPNWTDNTNWLSANPVSTWFGVQVASNRVTDVFTEANNLNGTLPPEIGDLTALIQLDLEDNLISGSIPIEIGGLVALEELDLENNDLTGTIPSTLWSLTNLQQLNLDENGFTGTISGDVGNLILLIELDLSENQITGTIPPEIGLSLSNLQILDLTTNQLTGSIPDELWNLTNINVLRLQDNQLTGTLSTDIQNLTQLVTFEVDDNQLSGNIPAVIGTALTNLQDLDLANNQFTGSIPIELGSLANLRYLYLERNQLSGSIPIELGLLSNLIDLQLYTNELTGSIPSELGMLTSLEDLDLSHNQLTGTIPSSLGTLIALTDMELDDNQLTGSIPSDLGNLTLLQDLQLDINQLSGAVPSTFTNLINLDNLELNDNQLNDLSDLSSLPAIVSLNVFNNNLEFDDLEPNAGITGISYSPQNPITGPGDRILVEGSPLNLMISFGGSSNQYQWAKDAVNIPGATNDNYSISNVATSDAGVYRLTATSTLVSGLVLSSEDINVTVIFPEIEVYQGLDNTGVVISDSQTSIIDLGNAVVGNDISQFFAIENTGTSDLNIASISSSLSDFIISGAPSVVSAGTTENFEISLSGSNPGTFNSRISIVSDDLDENPFTFDIRSTITEPEINIFIGPDNSGTVISNTQTTDVDLGSAVVGNDIVQTFAIENSGNSDLNISSISSSSPEFTVGSIPTIIGAGATDNFTITLSGANNGRFNSIISIVSDDLDENPFTFNISGLITEPEINVFVGSDNSGTVIIDDQVTAIDFGSFLEGIDVSQTFAIENTGDSDLNISSINSSLTAYTISGAPSVVSPGSTENFVVTLSGATPGNFDAIITIQNDDIDENPFTFNVSGSVLAPEINVFIGTDNSGTPIVSGQTESIDYGNTDLGVDVTRNFAIENTGTSDLNVSSINSSGTEFTVSSSISAIAPGTTESFTITLSGTNAGSFNSDISIASNDSDESSFIFNVSGNVQGLNIIDGEDETGVILNEDQEVDVGSTLINVDLDKMFVIENLSETSELIINEIVSDNPLFVVIDPPTNIVANSFAQFTVRLVATTLGIHTARISVSTNTNDFEFMVTGEVFEGEPPEVIVFNALTPNGDGVHDFMKVENILFYPNNQVTIINRNGDRVYEAEGYDNDAKRFEGMSNVGGSGQLDSGNYIYTIDKGDGYGQVSGFIFIKR